MPNGREKDGEFCENKFAPVIPECPDCVDAYMKRAEEIYKVAAQYEAENTALTQKLETTKRELEVANRLLKRNHEVLVEERAEVERLKGQNSLLEEEGRKLIDGQMQRAEASELQIEALRKLASNAMAPVGVGNFVMCGQEWKELMEALYRLVKGADNRVEECGSQGCKLPRGHGAHVVEKRVEEKRHGYCSSFLNGKCLECGRSI